MLFTGVLILVGAVAMTKFRRVYEAAILKTLGASSRLVGSVLLVEYGLLGLLAGSVGAAGGAALSWAISRYAIETAVASAVSSNRSSASSSRRCSSRSSGSSPASTSCAASRSRRCARSSAPCARMAAMDVLSCRIARVPRERGEESHHRMDVSGYKDALLRKKGELVGSRRHQAAAGVDGEQHPAGRHGRPGQRQQRGAHRAKLKQTDAKILQAIEEALLRIEKGTYGICRDCGEPIAEARLNAIPWTRVCITCKEKQQA